MKKIIQNVLAQNSKNEIAYLCGKCGKEVERESVRCRHCGSRLGNIRCPFCNFTGSVADFSKDTCPKCGRKNTPGQNELKVKKRNPETHGKISLTYKLFWFFFIMLSGLIFFLIYIFLKHFEIF